MKDKYPVILGDEVTVGHNATLHGCTIENLCLIGIGSIILNNVRVGEGSIIAAGSLVTEGPVGPPRPPFMGQPGQPPPAAPGRRPGPHPPLRRQLRRLQRRLLGRRQAVEWPLCHSERSEESACHESPVTSHAMKRRFQAVKGTRDILPPESALWNRVEQSARQVFAAYNFHEIRLPCFEETELFAPSVGADTDIVQKEMYSFEDRDRRISWKL